jgi:hypothetical protein
MALICKQQSGAQFWLGDYVPMHDGEVVCLQQLQGMLLLSCMHCTVI